VDTSRWYHIGEDYFLFNPGDKVDIVMKNFPIDMSAYTDYFISVVAEVVGELDTMDNRATARITHPLYEKVKHLPYIIDFEPPAPAPDLRVVTWAPPGYVPALYRGIAPGNKDITGPAKDHTRVDSAGYYLMTDASNAEFGDRAAIESICIDLSEATSPVMKFYYHMFGFEINKLSVEIHDDVRWTTIDEIFGDQQATQRSPWEVRVLDLSPWAGDFVRFRMNFFAPIANVDFGDIAVDDIQVYDIPPADLLVNRLINPNRDRSSCYSKNQKLEVQLGNNGAEPFDFTTDSVGVCVYINRNGTPHDTICKHIDWNPFKNDVTQQFTPLPPDSLVKVDLQETFDMYYIGDEFSFIIEVHTPNDSFPINNVFYDTIVARQDGGVVDRVHFAPNDSICSGEGIEVMVKDYFGQLRWYAKEENPSNSSTFAPGFNFPFDRENYIDFPDTNTIYKVRVCNNVFSVEDTVTVIKPYPAKAVNDARCESENRDLILDAKVPSNITHIEVYDSLVKPTYIPSINRMVDIMSDTLIYRAPVNNFSFNYSEWARTVDKSSVFAKKDPDKSDTFYLRTVINSTIGDCYSDMQLLTPVIASVNKLPTFDLKANLSDPTSIYDTICRGDTVSVLLNAGYQEGRQWKYQWTIWKKDSNGVVTRDTTQVDTSQTVAVDAWRLEKNTEYWYTVYVETDSGCDRQDTIGVKIYVDNKCAVGIDEVSGPDQRFGIFPNPTRDKVYINYFSDKGERGNVSIFSIKGEMMYQEQNIQFGNQPKDVSLQDYASGLYYIRIDTEKGNYIKKIIKQ
jgi:hypothetical protein